MNSNISVNTPLFAQPNDLRVPALNDFKAQSTQLHHALLKRGVSVQLSDALEGMSNVYGFANYATYRAAALAQGARLVDVVDLDPKQYVQYLVLSEDDVFSYDVPNCWLAFVKVSDVVMHPRTKKDGSHELPYNIDQLIGRNDYPMELFQSFRIISEDDDRKDEVDTTGFVVTGVLCQTPRVEKYGVPEFSGELGLAKKILEQTEMKSIKYPRAELVDTRDDTAGLTLFMVSVPNRTAAIMDQISEEGEF